MDQQLAGEADGAPEKIVLKLVRNVKQNDCRTVVVNGLVGGKGLLKEVRKLAANKLRIPLSNLRLFDQHGAELLEADKASAEARIKTGGTFYVSAGEESCVADRTPDLDSQAQDASSSISAGCGNFTIVAKESVVEAQAQKQLKWAASLSGVVFAVGLPDLHVGNGCPIGAAIATEGIIYPNLVGTDIGCGIMLVQTSLKASATNKPRILDRWVESVRVEGPWDRDTSGRLAEAGVSTTSYDDSLGTIGRGNHFAELQVVERIEDAGQAAELGLNVDDVYLCVHSGSRGYGESILQSHTKKFGPDHCAVESDEGQAYLAAHDQACKWAQVNRRIIAERMLDQLQATQVKTLLDITHNNVVEVRTSDSPQVAELIKSSSRTSVWLHRKGAAPTNKGPVLIPGSRGAFSFLVKPLDQLPFLSSGWSLAHGAGRALARSTARSTGKTRQSSTGASDFKTARQLGADLTTTSLGSRVVCEDKDLLFEERPEAYKDAACVVADLVSANLCTVIAVMRPVLTYKMKARPSQ
ncbi:hypothetical protein R1sor_004704 [Riccia sorocarpa]|uniref:3'-phosphate/5'-hydroxy nucleic acid ligase n=1 Tax=Riccia sorocarpa TaxID=122646 RepID=A0ABD3HHF3_9MARC